MTPRHTIDPVGTDDIARRLNVPRWKVMGWRRAADWPEPMWMISGMPAWPYGDITTWLHTTGRMTDDGTIRKARGGPKPQSSCDSSAS